MNIFQSLFNLFLAELEANASFRVGNFQIGVTSAQGNPVVQIALSPRTSPPKVEAAVTPPGSGVQGMAAQAKSTASL